MQISKLHINNFGSYVGDHILSLSNRGLVLIEGDNQDEFRMDSNGSGKSQIPDSLDWCITGVVPRGDHVDSIINDNENSCKVEVDIIRDDGDLIVIKRERIRKKTTNLSLFVNAQDLSALDIKETQKIIYFYLGIDRDIFHSTVLFAQTDLVHYADSTDSKRMDILTQLLQLDDISNLLVKAKSEVQGLNSRQDRLLGLVEGFQAQLQDLKKEDYSYQINKFEEDRSKQIALWDAELAIKADTYSKEQDAYSGDTYPRIIQELEASLVPENKDETNLLGIARELSRTRESIGIVESEIRHESKSVESINSELNKTEVLCPTCGQSMDRSILVASMVDHKFVLDQKVLILEDYKNTLLDLEVKYNEENIRVNAEYQKAVNHNIIIHTDIEKQRIKFAKVQALATVRSNLEIAIEQLKDLLTKKEKEVNPWLEIKRSNEAKIVAIGGDLDKYNSQLSSIGTLKSLYDFWVKGFGPKGLKSYILDSKLKELNDSINYWVNLLTGGTLWVELGSHKTNRSNKVVNSPDVKVCRWNTDGSITTRDYKSWSGGEKQRISLAIDFGLSRIIANRSKHSYNIMFLDEVFRHLDRGGKEAVMEMIQELAREKSSVFVVEHDSDFKNLFENKICVIKKDGMSTIQEITNNEWKKQDEKRSGKNLPSTTIRNRRPIKRISIRKD